MEKINLSRKVNYHVFLDRSQVSEVMKGSIYLSLDVNPACPNTVIEALSTGSPVVAFDTGAIPELINDSCSAVVKYGSNPWELGYPDVKSLAKAIIKVEKNYDILAKNAKKSAFENYNLEDVVLKYTDVIHKMF